MYVKLSSYIDVSLCLCAVVVSKSRNKQCIRVA
jgi:hypothetical protein